jgi:hypothetical protein
LNNGFPDNHTPVPRVAAPSPKAELGKAAKEISSSGSGGRAVQSRASLNNDFPDNHTPAPPRVDLTSPKPEVVSGEPSLTDDFFADPVPSTVAETKPRQERKQEANAAAPNFAEHSIADELSFNDDIFSNCAPSPPSERVSSRAQPSLDSDSSPPPRRNSRGPAAKGAAKPEVAQKIPKEPSVGSDQFGSIDLSFDIDTPPPKAKKAPQKPPPKKNQKPPPKAKGAVVREENSAELFEFDPDQIKFDFDGIDPFS